MEIRGNPSGVSRLLRISEYKRLEAKPLPRLYSERYHTAHLLPDNNTTYIQPITHSHIMSDTKDSSFNILGSSKLNTADGKNPTSSSATTSTSDGAATGQKNTEDYRKQCQSAHDALENKLRDEEREKKWSGRW